MKSFLAALASCAVVMSFHSTANGQTQCCAPDQKPAATHQGGWKDGIPDNHGAKDIAEEFRYMLKRDKDAMARPCGDRYERKLVNGSKQDNGSSIHELDGLSVGDMNAGQWSNEQAGDMPTALAIEQARARARAEKEVQIAVAKPGTRVCRKLAVGISESDWIRGVVVEAGSGHVCVKIDDPGHFVHTLNGIAVVRGSFIWDAVLSWIPCVE